MAHNHINVTLLCRWHLTMTCLACLTKRMMTMSCPRSKKTLGREHLRLQSSSHKRRLTSSRAITVRSSSRAQLKHSKTMPCGSTGRDPRSQRGPCSATMGRACSRAIRCVCNQITSRRRGSKHCTQWHSRPDLLCQMPRCDAGVPDSATPAPVLIKDTET